MDLNKKLRIYNYFDEVVLSHEVKMSKDSEEIYLLAAKKLGVKTNECIFIDDYGVFLRIAKSVGMKGILFKDSEKLRYELNYLLKQ